MFFFTNSLASSSQRTYKLGENCYLGFCRLCDVDPLPLSELLLCKLVAHLADQQLKHRTIKTYLSGVRYLQIRSGLPDPFQGALIPRLEYTSPIKQVESQGTKMLWAACCLAFFGFLRVGEMVTPDDGSYDPTAHLGFGDVAVDNPRQPSFVRVSIKQSKTDPFRKGVDLFIGHTGGDLCPLLSFMMVRRSGTGPLFVFADGRLLTRKRFVDAVRSALASAGIDQTQYCGHSFRIGAATTAAAKGIEDSIIKTLGRWESVAYLQYVRIPRSQLTQVSSVMVSP